MHRQVNIIDTGQKGWSDESYKAPNGKYYSSEEAFLNRQKKISLKNQCIDRLMELLDYKPGMKLPTLTYKRIAEYEQPYGYDVLLDTINAQEDAIRWALKNKMFGSETAKIMYIFAIIQNNAMTEFQKKIRLERAKREQEKQLANIEELDMKPVEVEHKKDVSDLLGDVSWI